MNTAHKDLRGFAYLTYSAVSSALLLVMVFLPLAPVFADELNSEAQEATPVQLNEDVGSESLPEAVPENDSPEAIGTSSGMEVPTAPSAREAEAQSDNLAPEIAEDEVVEDPTAIVLEDGIVQTDELSVEDEQVLNSEIPESENIAEVLAEEEETTLGEVAVSDDSAELVEDAVVLETDVSENPEEEETESSDEVAQDETDVSPESLGEVVVVNSVNDSRNEFSFSDNECTSAGDGTFYCVKADAEAQVSETDRIFSAPDKEGDREIYVEKDAVLVALTDNQYDDEDPYYDPVSDTAVWHRLINGRYQIISYDFDTEEEVQLTSDHYNNMHPNIFGDALVWQGWVGSDWEIFLSRNDEITMLTDNNIHDISPSVNGTHIVWQSFENSIWQMKVYDIRTGIINAVGDTEGGSIENPRFVLVYDTTSQAGDVETRGYDLKSGEVMELGAVPVSLPQELPDPDQTGEDRAIVTTITQLKPKTEGDTDDVPDNDGFDTEPETDDATIVIDAYEPEVPMIEEISTSTEDVTQQIEAIVIPPHETTPTASTEHIVDVIVTPYVEEIATSTDAH